MPVTLVLALSVFFNLIIKPILLSVNPQKKTKDLNMKTSAKKKRRSCDQLFDIQRRGLHQLNV